MPLSGAKPTFPSLQRGHPLSQGLSGGWPMCEGSGLTTYDLGGQSNTGTLTSGASWTGGPNGWCMSFSGTASNQVNCGSPLAGQTLANLTIAAWMYRSSTGNFVSFGWGDNSASRNDVLWFSDGNVYWQLEKVSVGTSFPNCALSGTGWHHFVSAFDGSKTGLARQTVYIDGALRTLTAGGNGPPSAYVVSGSFRVGYEQSNTRSSNGKADGVAVWNRTLSQEEVSSLYADSFQMYRRPRLVLAIAAPPSGVFSPWWWYQGGTA